MFFKLHCAPQVKKILCLIFIQVDDIKRHGPPKGFTEDGFEKNHASVRNELFN